MANISIETKKFTQLPTTQSLTDSSLMLARDIAGVKTIQFSDLRAQLQGQTYVQELKSKNILDSSKLEQGNISESTGADVVSTNRVRTGFIPVEASETYTASVGNSKVLVFAFLYDSSKTYLDYKILSGEGATSPTFTVSASTAYVRITVKNSDDSTITPANVTNFQLELGDTATPYVPFAETNIDLSAKVRRILQVYEPLIADGETIPTNVNLNTASYCNIGRYVCPLATTPATLVNCPTTNAFYMIVRNVTKTDITTSTLTWQYLLREITDVNGNQYTQTAFCGGTAGSWVFGVWKQIIAGCKTGTLTANTGTFSESYCRQSGDTVDIHGWLERLSISTQSHENAVTVSGVSLPSVPIRFVFTCWLGNNIASYAGYGVLDTNGKITLLKAVANSDKASFTITYVV